MNCSPYLHMSMNPCERHCQLQPRVMVTMWSYEPQSRWAVGQTMGRASMVALPEQQHVAVVAEAGRNPYYDVDQTMDCAPVEQVAEAAAEVCMHRAPVEKVAEAVAEVCMRRRRWLLPLPHR